MAICKVCREKEGVAIWTTGWFAGGIKNSYCSLRCNLAGTYGWMAFIAIIALLNTVITYFRRSEIPLLVSLIGILTLLAASWGKKTRDYYRDKEKNSESVEIVDTNPISKS